MSRNITSISKAISYLLRHGAPKEGIPYLEDGSILVDTVLGWYNNDSKYQVTYDDVQEIVDTDKKGRYTIRQIDDKTYIRANQGHSFYVVPETEQITLDNVEDFDVVLHGTFKKFEGAIRNQGLRVMSRQHIHMISLSRPNSFKMLRPEVELFVVVDVKSALKDGIEFCISTNNVVLSEGNANSVIPPEYLTFIDRVKSPCSGVLVIGRKSDEPIPYIAMVQTPKKYWSFPKGKKDKGEMSLQTALRELREETGILSKDLKLVGLPPFQEQSNKGGLASTYYTAYFKYYIDNEPLTPEDAGELTQAVWMPIKNILEWKDSEEKGYLHDRRQNFVKQLNTQLNLIKNETE